MSTATQAQDTQQELTTGGHLAPYAVAEAAWAHGHKYALSYCGKGKVYIARKATARILSPGESPREFCPECVDAHNADILAQLLDGGGLRD